MKEMTKKEPSLFDDAGKVPPNSVEHERYVLGTIMVISDAIDSVINILTPQMFYDKTNQQIFEIMCKMYKESKTIDMLTVISECEKGSNQIESYYIASLTEKIGSGNNIEFYAKIIAEKAMRRELIKTAYSLYQKGYDNTVDFEEVLGEATLTLSNIGNYFIKEDAQYVKEILPAVLNNIEKAGQKGTGISGIETGFPSLDSITQGWQNSDMIVIAARPSMGKTAFTISMAVNMARLGYKTLFFSLEMSKTQIVNRILSMETEINSSDLRGGMIDSTGWSKIDNKVSEIENLGIIIDDEAAMSVLTLRSKCRQYKKKYNFDIIMIDYLQLMRGTNQTNRNIEVMEISSTIKTIAKELNVPVVALSQLSRETGKRDNKRPILSDLRDSGAIEQDADIVAFIHRPEYYDIEVTDNGDSTKELGQIIIAKNRNGAVCDVNLRFREELAKFEEW